MSSRVSSRSSRFSEFRSLQRYRVSPVLGLSTSSIVTFSLTARMSKGVTGKIWRSRARKRVRCAGMKHCGHGHFFVRFLHCTSMALQATMQLASHCWKAGQWHVFDRYWQEIPFIRISIFAKKLRFIGSSAIPVVYSFDSYLWSAITEQRECIALVSSIPR